MKTKFGLVFDERDDGTKVWCAECQKCGKILVGERCPQVTIVSLAPGSDPIPPSQFDLIKKQVASAWESARKTGNPIVIADDRFKVTSAHYHGDIQRALELHATVCV